MHHEFFVCTFLIKTWKSIGKSLFTEVWRKMGGHEGTLAFNFKIFRIKNSLELVICLGLFLLREQRNN